MSRRAARRGWRTGPTRARSRRRTRRGSAGLGGTATALAGLGALVLAAVVVAAVVAAVVALTGPGDGADRRAGAAGSSQRAGSADDVLVLVTGASSELRPRLPAPAADLLLDKALGVASRAVAGRMDETDNGDGDGGGDGVPRVVVLGVDADRRQTEQSFDLTPRRGDGDDAPVENVARYRERQAASNVAAVDDAVASVTARADGHSLLLALQAADGRDEATIVVVSSGVDTVAPLDLRTAGFDFSREDYVEHLRATNELPDLSGTSVLLALTPPAGGQPALNLSTQRQLEGIWTAVITAAGAHVEVVPSASTSPPLATNQVPSVTVPQVGSPVRDHAGRTVFLLPSAVLFEPNSAELLDPAAARRELADVVTTAVETPDQTVSVVGHTADDGSGPDSGGPLSSRRAEVVRDLLVELGLPGRSITDVRGVGAREPLVQPPDSPANRTVVVTVATAG